jgi:putative ubiquitin-RnfH superfamily antitoxin RatB of RatAB toxin-antitoxin module
MVSVSPRMRDSLDYEEPDTIDPRMEWGFGSLTLSSSGYEDHDHDHIDDHRPFYASPDPSSSRRKKRQQQQQTDFDHVQDHEYQSTAHGDAFRLAVLKPGAGTQAIEIELIWGSIKAPQRRDYKCLSYCWQTTVQDAAILVDERRFEVTRNLLSALRSIRKRREKVLIWIDQICINQRDFVERGHQVSIMKHIYSRARQVVVRVQ